VLVLVQDYKVYGYVTNTGVRFVLVLDDKDNKDGRCENACTCACCAGPACQTRRATHRSLLARWK